MTSAAPSSILAASHAGGPAEEPTVDADVPDHGRADPAASAVLTIDPGAVVANWRHLAGLAAPAACAAVVKADAYGLGVGLIAPALRDAGCRDFFVATVDEAVALRALLPDPALAIHALNGSPPGAEPLCAAWRIVPVVNSLAQLERWRLCARAAPDRLPLALQLDTFMSRFGLAPEETVALASGAVPLDGLDPVLLMSHLACADRPSHPANARQLAAFRAAREVLRPVLGPVAASLAASSGIFLGPDYHLDLVRPGAALYGIRPQEGEPNPMRETVRLEARVMQIREIAAGTAVGYGATWTADTPTRVATVACGYADGFLRAGGNRSAVSLADGTLLPVIGRVSMDSITLDATAPEAAGLREGDFVTLIGGARPVDDVARDAGTIGYEILTALGGRYRRRAAPLVARVP